MHIFKGSCEVTDNTKDAIWRAEMNAFESATEYIRGKEFEWFKFSSGLTNKGGGVREAICHLEFSEKI